jgi:hypothetical protein
MPVLPDLSQRSRIKLAGIAGVILTLLLGGALIVAVAVRGHAYSAFLMGIVAFSCAACAFACLPAWRWPRWRPVVVIGWVCALLTPLVLFAELGNFRFRGGDWDEPLVILLVSTPTWAYLCLTTLARVRTRWRCVIYVARVSACVLAGVIGAVNLGRFDTREAHLGILGSLTLLGCATLGVGALHVLGAVQDQLFFATLALRVVCPRCGAAQTLPAGRGRCNQCGLVLRITIDEVTCPACGCVLAGLSSASCPECGAPVFERARAAPQA